MNKYIAKIYTKSICNNFSGRFDVHLQEIQPILKFPYLISLGLLRVSEYSDIHGSEYKIEYGYSSLPKSLDRDLFFFFLPFLFLKQEVFQKMVH